MTECCNAGWRKLPRGSYPCPRHKPMQNKLWQQGHYEPGHVCTEGCSMALSITSPPAEYITPNQERVSPEEATRRFNAMRAAVQSATRAV